MTLPSPANQSYLRGIGFTPVPVQVNRQSHPGLDGVIDRIGHLVREGRGNEQVRQTVLSLTRSIPADLRTGQPDRRDFGKIAAVIYEWMKRSIAYVRDPHGIERLQSADATLRLRSGDCDDMTIMAGAMLESVGIPTRLVVISEAAAPADFSHIYLEYQHQGQWIPFDVVLASHAGDVIPEHRIGAKMIRTLDDFPTPTLPSRYAMNPYSPSIQQFSGLGLDPATAALIVQSGNDVWGALFGDNRSSAQKQRDQMRNWLNAQGFHGKVNSGPSWSIRHWDTIELENLVTLFTRYGEPVILAYQTSKTNPAPGALNKVSARNLAQWDQHFRSNGAAITNPGSDMLPYAGGSGSSMTTILGLTAVLGIGGYFLLKRKR